MSSSPPTPHPAASWQTPVHPSIKIVSSFEELIDIRFANGINAICWPRVLSGDYAEVVRLLNADVGINHIDDETLLSLPVSDAGKIAIEIMLADQRLLREHGLDPILDSILGYLHDDEQPPSPMRTDVCSYHIDTATIEADTYLCTYHGASSEGLFPEQAIRKIDIPEIRAHLLTHFGGTDDADFEEYLSDHFFDLHYAPLSGATPYSFGHGNLWRVAIGYPDVPVPPCVHRAPDPIPGQPARLLLIS